MNHGEQITTLQPLAELERNLQEVRQRTLIATRKGDFPAIARLCNEAVRLKWQIAELELEADMDSGTATSAAMNSANNLARRRECPGIE